MVSRYYAFMYFKYKIVYLIINITLSQISYIFQLSNKNQIFITSITYYSNYLYSLILLPIFLCSYF